MNGFFTEKFLIQYNHKFIDTKKDQLTSAAPSKHKWLAVSTQLETVSPI